MSKKIVKKLNEYFYNNSELINLCNHLSNNPEKVMQVISKIIKYAFVNKEFINSQQSLVEISEHVKGIDTQYQEYLNKRVITLFPKKIQFDTDLTSTLDSDIRMTDIQGLRLPTIEKIEEICKQNDYTRQTKHTKKHYIEQRGFDIEGFTYTRKELINIDSSFRYDYPEATGNISKDFANKYHDERYKDRPTFLHPLHNDYETNIKNIKTHTDILLKKEGDVYEIKNGRHRILYIMKHGIPVEIPVTITRRIEDREFNEILCILKENYHATIYKNNLLNDEPNILIVINGMAYEIKNKDELLSFYRNIRDKKTIENNFNVPFNVASNENIETYENMIYQKYLEVGNIILTTNFTDLSKYFDGINNLFYKAFERMQQYYQESIVYKVEFTEYYQNKKEAIKNIRFNAEEWQRIMGSPKRRR